MITKYIENAKEIEMDAVARGGKMIGHFVSEHVENAGVHSGDATLILPPQDLDPETVRRIEDATSKIGNALDVTGPFNIQFIAKENEIKVIECNVRASRSFPFVSKVMGVDLIELATKAIMGVHVAGYPPVDIPRDYVGVKVPQFSFSRLSGADPVLGVEMASTGEVACFGKDKYEAYIKALISTGFKLPERNILLSIGSLKDKKEMLPSIEKLHRMGYTLFATAGTADYLQENNVPVNFLESLSSEHLHQKAEYSLTQHLSKATIHLYINLPSSNRFRRPANYMSQGYQTRRMAVDYQIPLITNVKNAKILVEALARRYDFEVKSLDYQTSHRTVILPGLINVGAFVPGVAIAGNRDLPGVTRASIVSGFSMIRVLPVGLEASITDARSLKIAQECGRREVYCDYNFSIAATSWNSEHVEQVVEEVGSLFIPFNHLSGNVSKVATIKTQFLSWPNNKAIITDAKELALSRVMLLASLSGRKLHVTNVTTEDDIELIATSKSQGLEVTCDVSVYALFLSQEDYPQCSFLPTSNDQKALWSHMPMIDILSVGSLPYQLAYAVNRQGATPTVGIADTLPLLLTAVSDGRLSIQQIVSKLHNNPKEIFQLHDQGSTSVEIEVDRSYVLQKSASWSPFVGKAMKGSVQRVIFQNQTMCLDSELMPDAPPCGMDMSAHTRVPDSPKITTRHAFSPALHARPDAEVRQSQIAVRPASRLRPIETFGIHSPAGFNAGTHHDLEPPLYPEVLSMPSTSLETTPRSSFKQRHILSVSQFTRPDLHQLFTVASEMKLRVQRQGVLDILKGRVLCTIFYEPSTRTSASFDAAMQRLGGRTVAISTSYSSTQKGESLQDTIRTLGCYGDAVVLRHPDGASAAAAAKVSPVPIINGGNGSLEHPTQAFLDLYTIREELGTVTGLTITFVGDLYYGRTVHSLVMLLQHYDVHIQLVSPRSLALPADVRQRLLKSGQLVLESEKLTPELVSRSDVLYCTRVQKERFEDAREYERLRGSFIVDNGVLKHAKHHMVVMHPLPRNEEVSEEVDFDQRAAYFRQVSSLPPIFLLLSCVSCEAGMLICSASTDEIRPLL